MLRLRRSFKLGSVRSFSVQANGVPKFSVNHSLNAEILKNSLAYEPWKNKTCLESIDPSEVSPSIVGFLLHGFTFSDSLGSAERLFQSWMSLYLTSNPSDVMAADLLKKLKNNSVSASIPMTVEEFDLSGTNVGVEKIPFSAWVAMLSMYGKRRAFRQCNDILAYLEHMRDTNAAYTHNGGDEMEVFENLDDLLNPTYLVATEFIPTGTTLEAVGKRNNQVIIHDLPALQWNAVYHIVLRAQCEAHHYSDVAKLLKKMRTQSATVPRIPAAIALLGALCSPVQPFEEVHESVGLCNEDPLLRSILARQTLGASLRGDITATIKKLAVQRHSLLRGPTAHFYERIENNINTLAKQYVKLLCKLDLMEDCKLFVEEIRTHINNLRFPRTGGSEDGEIEGVYKVCGFYSNEWIQPYMRRLRESGDWATADALSNELLREEKQFVRELYRDRHTAPGVKKSFSDRAEEGENDAMEEANEGFLSTAATKLSQKRGMLYHETTTSLREAGEIVRLAKLMVQYQETVDPVAYDSMK